MQLAVLDELSRPWTVRINQEVELCEKAAESIGVLCKELKPWPEDWTTIR